jgi:hypothetical protein
MPWKSRTRTIEVAHGLSLAVVAITENLTNIKSQGKRPSHKKMKKTEIEVLEVGRSLFSPYTLTNPT